MFLFIAFLDLVCNSLFVTGSHTKEEAKIQVSTQLDNDATTRPTMPETTEIQMNPKG